MSRLHPLPVVVLFAIIGLWLGTLGNHFPFYYHPDEVKKVDQILSGERNFNHPLLLLNTVELAWKLAGAPHDRQRVVELGRTVSAVFTVLGTAAFLLAAWRWFGPVAGVATGAWLTFHQQIFELAHYFKEDPALYLGTGLFAWAVIACFQRASRLGFAGLAIAVALAASAKYLGLILLVPALILCWYRPPWADSRARSIAFLLGIFLVVFLGMNLRIFLRPDIFETSFSKEMAWAVAGGKRRHPARPAQPVFQYLRRKLLRLDLVPARARRLRLPARPAAAFPRVAARRHLPRLVHPPQFFPENQRSLLPSAHRPGRTLRRGGHVFGHPIPERTLPATHTRPTCARARHPRDCPATPVEIFARHPPRRRGRMGNAPHRRLSPRVCQR